MKFTKLRERLRNRLNEANRILVAPGAYDPLSARQIELAGFEAVHVGSYSLASSLGLPDVGILNLTEISDRVQEICATVSVPVIADAETGFNGPEGMERVVRRFEQAGACAIHIEDQVSGKHTSAPKRVMPLDLATHTIRAAVAARDDPNFMIIARTDVAWVTHNVQDAIERVHAFVQAGADAVMPIGLTLEQLRDVRHIIPSTVVIVNTHDNSVEEEQAAGANLVFYHSFCVDAAAYGVQQALQRFTETGHIRSVQGTVASAEEMEDLLQYAKHDDLLKRYASPSTFAES
jgi:methylisocitrate lyase